ncbi:MAG: transposase [Sedimentisphaerales bacterium]
MRLPPGQAWGLKAKHEAEMTGYMVTWTTYGSWLPGDKRGYVRQGKIMSGDPNILKASQSLQKSTTVTLDSDQKAIIRRAILREAERIGHTIEALAVCTNHIHLVARPSEESIDSIVSRYKNVAMFSICKDRPVRRIWTRGFDKRFCFNEKILNQRIEYVKRHGPD